jgi:hypothetical protein
MALNDVETRLYAYFLATDAPKTTVDGRFYPREDFVRIFKDRIYFGTAAAGSFTQAACENVANTIVDALIASGALTTTRDKFSVVLHQFVPATYKQTIQDLCDADALVRAAAGQGPGYWKDVLATAST